MNNKKVPVVSNQNITFGSFTIEDINSVLKPEDLSDHFTVGWSSDEWQCIRPNLVKKHNILDASPLPLGTIIPNRLQGSTPTSNIIPIQDVFISKPSQPTISLSSLPPPSSTSRTNVQSNTAPTPSTAAVPSSVSATVIPTLPVQHPPLSVPTSPTHSSSSSTIASNIVHPKQSLNYSSFKPTATTNDPSHGDGTTPLSILHNSVIIEQSKAEISINASTSSVTISESASVLPSPAIIVVEPPKPPISWADIAKMRDPSNSKSIAPGYVAKPKQARKPSFYDKPCDILRHFEPSMHRSRITPRGLVNNGNMCFMNAILQPLVYCPPFFNLMEMIGKRISHSFHKKMLLTEAVVMFLHEFDLKQDDSKATESSGASAPFAPEYVYDALRSLNKVTSIKGRQEDAEEFLGFLLDGLHEELLTAMQEEDNGKESEANGVNPKASESNDTWHEVGKGNKTLITRRMEMAESPITKIFSGRMRSTIRAPGARDSVTNEPFVFLHLDINPESPFTIDDALKNIAVPETLDEFMSTTKGIKVEATKQNSLDTFPPVLMLQLKRFVYSHAGGTQKIHRHVAYSTELEIRPDLISSSTRLTTSSIKYQLFAVVYHHGKLAEGGHYTCDVLRAPPNQWLSIDDAAVQKVHVSTVLGEKKDRDVYLLMYYKV